MKFIMGCITGWIIFILALVGFYFYFDVDSYSTIKTNELEKLQQQQQQQQNTQPTEQKHNGITPPNMKEKTANEFDESQERKSEIQALQENDKAQEWKKEYNEINEGTDENPYVIINGRKVDPKHVTGNENNK